MELLKPRIHACTIEDDGESFSFFVKEPSGRQILLAGEKAKTEKPKQSIDNARQLLEDFVVHEDGTKLDKEEVEGILDMRLSAMEKVADAVRDKIGLKRAQERAEGIAKNV